MITAYGDEATTKRATELGAAGLLPKPIDFGRLRQEIDQRLKEALSRKTCFSVSMPIDAGVRTAELAIM